jgi:hypothetical protein
MYRDDHAPGLMSTIRWVLIVLTVVLAGWTVVSLAVALVRSNLGDAGYSQRWPELVIRAVRPGYPADRAGLRAGDTIDIAPMSLHGRLTVLGYRLPLNGESAQLSIVRDGKPLTFRFRYGQQPSNSRVFAIALTGMVTAMLIALLVVFVLLRSPTIEAFALWGFAITYSYPDNWQVGYLAGDWADAIWSGCFTDIISGIAAASLIVLGLRATQWPHRGRYEIAAVALGAGVFALTQYADVLTLVFGIVPPQSLARVAGQAYLLPAILLGIIVGIAFVQARGPSRVRLRWITIGFGCLVAGFVVRVVFRSLPALDFAIWPTFVNYFFINAGFATLVFAILRHDLFDVGFVVNRAAIYTALTGVLVGAFAGLNWSIGVLLKQTGLALPVDVILAAAVGLSLNVIQRRVDRNVDRIFFRTRYLTEQRLQRVARALPNVADGAAITQALVVEPVEALGLHAAALYRLTPAGAYELVAARGWPPGSPAEVAAGDPLVLHLSGVDAALRLEGVPHDAAFPHGLPRPRIAFPLWSRRELIAFALYSTHHSGAMLDPDEVALIERIATAATIALERVAAASLHERYAALKADYESIKAQRDEFLAILGGTHIPPRAIASDG